MAGCLCVRGPMTQLPSFLATPKAGPDDSAVRSSVRRFKNVRIENLITALAPERVTSDALEAEMAPTYERLGIPSRCIQGLTGIVARRFWGEDTPLAEPAVDVARRCLQTAGMGEANATKRLGLLVNTSVSKEYLEPSAAALIHGDLGLSPDVENFDLSNACLGFVAGMSLAGTLIESRSIDAALVVAAESSRKVVQSTIARLLEPTSTMDDYKSFLPTLTLGSGAVAMLLVHTDFATSEKRFDGVVTGAATAHNRICMGTYDWMRTDATTLLKEGVELASRTWSDTQRALDVAPNGVDQFINHQVGATHLATLFRALSLPVDRAFLTYPEFGNMGAAALPFTLGLAEDAGKVSAGQTLALMGIGSGLNCAMAKVRW